MQKSFEYRDIKIWNEILVERGISGYSTFQKHCSIFFENINIIIKTSTTLFFTVCTKHYVAYCTLINCSKAKVVSNTTFRSLILLGVARVEDQKVTFFECYF